MTTPDFGDLVFSDETPGGNESTKHHRIISILPNDQIGIWPTLEGRCYRCGCARPCILTLRPNDIIHQPIRDESPTLNWWLSKQTRPSSVGRWTFPAPAYYHLHLHWFSLICALSALKCKWMAWDCIIWLQS